MHGASHFSALPKNATEENQHQAIASAIPHCRNADSPTSAMWVAGCAIEAREAAMVEAALERLQASLRELSAAVVVVRMT
jgi:hypothetical protein